MQARKLNWRLAGCQRCSWELGAGSCKLRTGGWRLTASDGRRQGRARLEQLVMGRGEVRQAR